MTTTRLYEARVQDCEFAFKCPLKWNALTKTTDANVRYCGSCERKVYLCEDGAEARERAGQGQCVAVPSAYVRTDVSTAEASIDESDGSQLLVGSLETPYETHRVSPPIDDDAE